MPELHPQPKYRFYVERGKWCCDLKVSPDLTWQDLEQCTPLYILRLTLQKWLTILVHHLLHPECHGVDTHGSMTCACCVLYNKRASECRGCPIAAREGTPYCEDTPYYSYAHEVDATDITQAGWVRLANTEFQYLLEVYMELLEAPPKHMEE